jgi:cation:H+ antiporter
MVGGGGEKERSMMLPYLLLLFGFGLLIKAADWLVEGASALARRLKVSDLVIGLTVVAFGTSTPELFVNLVAAAQGKTALALGNVIGSNIANILLILGIAAIITPLAATAGTVWKEIPFSLLAAVVLGIVVNDRLLGGSGDAITRGDGLVLLCFLAIFFYYTAAIAFDAGDFDPQTEIKSMPLTMALFRVAMGLAGLVLGGWLIVANATLIAKQLGMSEALIGLTVVAIGTSLPELATSAVAAYKGNADIAIGNVVGSNIFNIFFILGITSAIHPIPCETGSNVEVLVLVAASLLLFLSMFTGRKRSIDRWEGVVFVLLYIAFVSYKIAFAG